MSALAFTPGRSIARTPISPERAEIRRLTAENEHLLAEVESLREALYGEAPDFASLGLRPQERVLLSILMRFEVVTFEQTDGAFEADRPNSDGRTSRYASVIAYTLRRSLMPHNIEIDNVRGVGYRLSSASKTRVREICGAGRAA